MDGPSHFQEEKPFQVNVITYKLKNDQTSVLEANIARDYRLDVTFQHTQDYWNDFQDAVRSAQEMDRKHKDVNKPPITYFVLHPNQESPPEEVLAELAQLGQEFKYAGIPFGPNEGAGDGEELADLVNESIADLMFSKSS